LFEIITIEKTLCLPKSQIKEIEKIIRLHYELQINLEGVNAIYGLLNRVEMLQEEIVMLNNKLDFYENF
jgi:hypothetical protein